MRGPYSAYSQDDDSDDGYSDTAEGRLMKAHNADIEGHPTGFNDGIDITGIPSDDERYACPSMTALFAWFGGHLPGLLRAGYRIQKYRTTRYYIGRTELQVIFDVSSAQRI